ncbi:MAG: ABC transporter ATP-binding protein [Kiloniellales bacterium]
MDQVGDATAQPPGRRPAAEFSDTPWLDPAARPFIDVRGVTKKFGDFVAVDDVDLQIYRGELFCLLGASGCGKSTLLRMLAGFEPVTSGQILIDGTDMAGIAPYERPVNMMFQSYALFPHMTVESNVAFGLKQERLPRGEIKDRVAEVLQLVQLSAFAKRKPHQLSGGQRQRVALARSLVKRPKVLLLDEPLGALDKKLREQTQFELMNIQDEVGITFVVVTHDQEEAMTLSTRIAVMNQGRIAQVGTPSEIYEFPGNRFVADFIGSINLFEGRVAYETDEFVAVHCPELESELQIDHGPSVQEGQKVWVAIRPEKIAIQPDSGGALPAENAARGAVEGLGYLGSETIYRVRLGENQGVSPNGGRMIEATAPNLTRSARRTVDWDDNVVLTWDSAAGVVLTS